MDSEGGQETKHNGALLMGWERASTDDPRQRKVMPHTWPFQQEAETGKLSGGKMAMLERMRWGRNSGKRSSVTCPPGPVCKDQHQREFLG